MKIVVIVVVVLMQINLISSSILPKNFPQLCSKSLPNYSQCKDTYFDKAKPFFMKGIPTLNLPSMHPLILEKLAVNYTINDQLSFIALFKNVTSSGFNETQLTNYNFDHKTLEGGLTITLPNLRTELEYDISANIFGNRLNNSGSIKNHAKNISNEYNILLKPIMKAGVKHYSLQTFSFRSTLEDVDIQVISNEPLIQPTINTLINFYDQDHKRAIAMMEPVYKNAITAFARSILEYAFDVIPAEEFISE